MTPDKTIAIESLAQEDVAALFNLLQMSGLPVDGLDKHLHTALVAKSGDEIVGSAALEMYGGSALRRSVAVTEARRGTGMGRQIMEAAIGVAQQHKLQRVYLLTETAADWFPRFGFAPIARSAVDLAVQQSVEFTSACPTSVQVMLLEFAASD